MSGLGRVSLVTRAGSQANRRSIELAEAVRGLVEATIDVPAVPASEVFVVLGHLHSAGFGLAQGLQELAACLARSTEAGLYWAAGEDVDPSEVADTAMSMTEAVDSLTGAADCAAQCGSLAATAQRHIAGEAQRVEVRLTAHRATAGTESPQPNAEEGSPEDWMADREWLTLEEAGQRSVATRLRRRSGPRAGHPAPAVVPA